MSDQTFERATLDGKDREQLQAIANAVGVKGVSRMKKADLVDAIIGAASGGGGESAVPKAPATERRNPERRTSEPSPATGPESEVAAPAAAASPSDASPSGAAAPSTPIRSGRIRSARASEADPIAAIAAEEAALASRADSEPAPPEPAVVRAPRPDGGRQPAPATGVSDPEATAARSVGAERGSGESGPAHDGGRDSGREGGRDGDAYGADGDGESRRSRRNRRRKNRDGRETGLPTDAGDSTYNGDLVEVEGLLELRDEGYGFLRCSGYLAGRHDAYVSASQVRRFALRKGDRVAGAVRPATSTEKYPALTRVDAVNGVAPEAARGRPRFEELTPLFPDEKLRLELTDDPTRITGRVIDLVAPIGKGQRAMVVSPPKAGKTTIIKEIVHSIERNHPECDVIVLLVDERPEEVTDMRRSVQRADVVASTFDRPSDEHCHVAELAIERAKRLVEDGRDVVVVLDGITRLARAYNLAAPATGRIMSGGIDAGALYPPKKFFGAARNVEEGGSLTIIATALVETNSKMDEHIFEEFKGTGNMELRLDRRLAERRIYPAIDVEASGTRHEELLFDRIELQQVWKLRKVLGALDHEGGHGHSSGKGTELLVEKLRGTRSNREFLSEVSKASSLGG